MAVYVVLDPQSGSIREDRRHLDLWCVGERSVLKYVGRSSVPGHRGRVPVWSENARAIAYVSNTKRLQAMTHRCGHCFADGGPLPSDQAWVGWENVVAECFPEEGVYDIADNEARICQIGSGSPARVRARMRASHRSRFGSPDTIWWMYDALRAGRVPTIRSLPVGSGETFLVAEEHWRETRRRGGWQVSSET